MTIAVFLSLSSVALIACSGCSSTHIIGDADSDEADATDTEDIRYDLPDGYLEAIECKPNTCSEGMTYVPCGPTLIGADPEDPCVGWGDAAADERPEHIAILSSYCIDTLEVTNDQWHECVSSGACTEPIDFSDGVLIEDYYTNPDYGDYPVVFVDWQQAFDFCAWAGKRLPWEAEWEKAARGGCEVVNPPDCGPEDDMIFPWGNEEFDCTRANSYDSMRGCGFMHPTTVGSYPLGSSPYGILDMAGNVAERTADYYVTDYYITGDPSWIDPHGPASGDMHSVRGSGWYSLDCDLRVSLRYGYDEPDGHYGLRCADDPP